jgi:hypothetical protein
VCACAENDLRVGTLGPDVLDNKTKTKIETAGSSSSKVKKEKSLAIQLSHYKHTTQGLLGNTHIADLFFCHLA